MTVWSTFEDQFWLAIAGLVLVFFTKFCKDYCALLRLRERGTDVPTADDITVAGAPPPITLNRIPTELQLPTVDPPSLEIRPARDISNLT